VKILYGVVGEGMGHAVRSRVVIEHLEARGHRVKIVVSGRAYAFLAKHFADVVEISGLALRYEENAVDRDATALKILIEGPGYALDNVDAWMRDVRGFDADAVISDFDSFAYVYAKAHGKPLLSIDNQHAIPLLQHPDEVLVVTGPDGAVLRDYHADFDLARRLIRTKMTGARHYLVTTFFFPPIKPKYRRETSLFPPILRPEILAAKSRVTRGDHVLVYQTSASNVGMLDVLAQLGAPFHVYGFLRPDTPLPAAIADRAKPEGDDLRFAPNVLLKRFSEGGFIDDLASARAVITGGGFTLMGEAVYLGKPVYSIPIAKHFEQIVSARYLELLGYGEHHEQVTREAVEAFLARSDTYADELRGHTQDGNRALLAKLDQLLAELATRR
jgi:uncharacterized protein (TIGR00661 family)